MKKLFLGLVLFSLLLSCSTDPFDQHFVTDDIENFWEAYTQIIATEDTSLQQQYLRDLYLHKGTAGLRGLIATRRYTEEDFLTSIHAYPQFWKSLQPNTEDLAKYQNEIKRDIKKLKQLYPPLKPATIYFSIGAFRTNGTTYEGNVLIGSEMALMDDEMDMHELPERFQAFRDAYKPLDNLALLCTHEYIHTQQQEIVNILLYECLYEGVAEFLSCKATGKPSNTPAVLFGKENQEAVVAQFVEDLYLTQNKYNWLWGENTNALQVRDLGYYIGYEICERYYNNAADKQKAVRELIELDYTDEKEVERIVDASGLLPKSITQLYNEYESKRPTVLGIEEFENGSQSVDSDINQITVLFSEPLNGRENGLDFGPLGKAYYPKVNNATRQWESNNQSYSFRVDLEPGKIYQMTIGENFRLENGIRLKPYLIEFQTKP